MSVVVTEARPSCCFLPILAAATASVTSLEEKRTGPPPRSQAYKVLLPRLPPSNVSFWKVVGGW